MSVVEVLALCFCGVAAAVASAEDDAAPSLTPGTEESPSPLGFCDIEPVLVWRRRVVTECWDSFPVAGDVIFFIIPAQTFLEKGSDKKKEKFHLFVGGTVHDEKYCLAA